MEFRLDKKEGETLRRELIDLENVEYLLPGHIPTIFILFLLIVSLHYLHIIVSILASVYKTVLLETSIPNCR